MAAVHLELLEQRVLCARTDTLLTAGWRFARTSSSGPGGVAFNDSAWTAVTLPHTWNAADGQDGGYNYFRGPSWYRKHLSIDAAQANQRLFLKFDGSNLVTDLWVNGQSVGKHQGGYSAFAFDITPFVRFGADNVLAVKVDNYGTGDVPPRIGDWTFFGGLYRDVHLIATPPAAHIDLLDLGSPGVFLRPTNVSAASAELRVTTEVRNDSADTQTVTVTSTVLDAAGNTVRTLTSKQSVTGRSTSNVVQNTTILSPHLWNGLSDPYQYRVRVKVTDAAGAFDQLDQPLGFRSFKVDAATGFWLNGKRYELKGIGFHQDRLNKGFATSSADRAEDLKLLKEIGANAARLVHYAHAQDTLDGLDRAGIVSWAEIPLIENAKETSAYADNAKQQLRELIRQNYNHPSIFFWGLFNEPDDTAVNNTLLGELDALANAEDPTRVSVMTSDVPPAAAVNLKADAIAFNKYLGWYYGYTDEFGKFLDDAHAANPTRAIGVGEYGAGGSIFQHADPPPRPSAGGTFHPEEYQNLLHEAMWQQIKDKSYLWCKFTWSLFDFAADGRKDGDTKGRNDKGLITYDHKTRKDAFYFYKANWSSSPVIYITSRRFTARTEAATHVKIYSNLASVTLKVNGVSYGAKTSANRIFIWNVTLSNGNNKIEVSGTRSGVTYTDACTWNLSTPATVTFVHHELVSLSPSVWQLATSPDQDNEDARESLV